MIFNTSTGFNVEMKDVSFLDAGIHENVALAGVRFDRSPNGNLFIEFKFSKNGMSFTHTEYEPTKFGDEPDEKLQEKADTQVKRIMQIMKVWYSLSVLSFTASNFETFGNWVATMMNAADKSILVRIKVVYNNSGYTGLPRYWKYTFIESMAVEAKNSKIKELGIDLFQRPEAGDKEVESKTSSQVFSATVGAAVPNGDTPF